MTNIMLLLVTKLGIPFIEQVFILLFAVRFLNCFKELCLRNFKNLCVLFLIPVIIVNSHSFFTLPVFNGLFDKVLPVIQFISVIIGIFYTSFSINWVTKKEFKKVLRHVIFSFLIYMTLQIFVVLSLTATTSITIKAINNNNFTACVVSASVEFLLFSVVLGFIYNDRFTISKNSNEFDFFTLILNAKELRNDYILLAAILIIIEFVFCFVFGYCNTLKSLDIIFQIVIYFILAIFPFVVLWLTSRYISNTYYLSELYYKDNINNINIKIDKAINLAVKNKDKEILKLLLSIKSSNSTI